ncbi:MAG TPA: hypothetical protein VFD59_17315, partial [Nocardioidaceae bacterium]|nr:hypothetical protein [Nocardioidaceae bacterium]
AELESVLPEELQLEWRRDDSQPSQADTKRALITGYIDDWSVAELAAFARRLSTYPDIFRLHQEQLASLISVHERGQLLLVKSENVGVGAQPSREPCVSG